jgi:hypothetical protein
LQRRCLDRGVFCSLDELTTTLEDWIKFWNANARPFTWTKTAGQIIDRICRYCSRISGPGHWGIWSHRGELVEIAGVGAGVVVAVLLGSMSPRPSGGSSPGTPPVTGRGRTAGKRPHRGSTKSMVGRCGSDN